MSWARRSNWQIICEILKMKRAGKTKIMYRVNMNYRQLAAYLDFLESNGLIERLEDNGRVTYAPTERGVNLRERIEGLLKELSLEEWPDKI